MAHNDSEILHNHLRLCQWQDELEFLCFVLCDIIRPPETTQRKTSQTLELLKFVEIIDKECESPQGRLRELLSENELSELKSCLRQAKQIRNAVAHHVPTNNRVIVKKQALAKSTMATLESVIRRGAERYKIDQVCASAKALQLQTKINKVNWYPIAHTSTTIPALRSLGSDVQYVELRYCEAIRWSIVSRCCSCPMGRSQKSRFC